MARRGANGASKKRESQRDCIRRVLGNEWQTEYQPENFNLAVVMPNWGLKISRADEAPLRQDFFACAETIDKGWHTNAERFRRGYYHTDLSRSPVMAKYFRAIRFIEGTPHGLCWIDVEEDGGAYDPMATVRTLEQALGKKVALYSSPDKQAHLGSLGLSELALLVHGGFNAYRYNTPNAPLSLDDIARRGANFLAIHPQRQIFNRVWFFHSLDSADDANQLLGFPAGYGRVRWLAQLWPTFTVYPSSLGG
jgi:hypothetical protein